MSDDIGRGNKHAGSKVEGYCESDLASLVGKSAGDGRHAVRKESGCRPLSNSVHVGVLILS